MLVDEGLGVVKDLQCQIEQDPNNVGLPVENGDEGGDGRPVRLIAQTQVVGQQAEERGSVVGVVQELEEVVEREEAQ